MSNIISKEKNTIFSKVLEDLKGFFSILKYEAINHEEGFDSIISSSTNPEEIELAQILKQDELDRELRIKQQSKETKKSKAKSENKTISVQQPKVQNIPTKQVNIETKKIENNNKEQDLDR